MAISAIDKDNWSVSLFSALNEMLTVKMLLLERFASIHVLSWVMKSASHGGAVVEVTKVAKGRFYKSYFLFAVYI